MRVLLLIIACQWLSIQMFPKLYCCHLNMIPIRRHQIVCTQRNHSYWLLRGLTHITPAVRFATYANAVCSRTKCVHNMLTYMRDFPAHKLQRCVRIRETRQRALSILGFSITQSIHRGHAHEQISDGPARTASHNFDYVRTQFKQVADQSTWRRALAHLRPTDQTRFNHVYTKHARARGEII